MLKNTTNQVTESIKSPDVSLVAKKVEDTSDNVLWILNKHEWNTEFTLNIEGMATMTNASADIVDEVDAIVKYFLTEQPDTLYVSVDHIDEDLESLLKAKDLLVDLETIWGDILNPKKELAKRYQDEIEKMQLQVDLLSSLPYRKDTDSVQEDDLYDAQEDINFYRVRPAVFKDYIQEQTDLLQKIEKDLRRTKSQFYHTFKKMIQQRAKKKTTKEQA